MVAVLLSGFMALTTSCNDFLDKAPDDQLTMEMVFSDKIRTEDWLAGVYSSVPSPMWGYFKDHGYNIMGDDIDDSSGLGRPSVGAMCMPIPLATGALFRLGIPIIG